MAGTFLRELEHTRVKVMPEWLGSDLLDMLAGFGAIINDIGGYPLPPAAPQT